MYEPFSAIEIEKMDFVLNKNGNFYLYLFSMIS